MIGDLTLSEVTEICQARESCKSWGHGEPDVCPLLRYCISCRRKPPKEWQHLDSPETAAGGATA